MLGAVNAEGRIIMRNSLIGVMSLISPKRAAERVLLETDGPADGAVARVNLKCITAAAAAAAATRHLRPRRHAIS